MECRVALISANRLWDPYPVYPIATAYLKSYMEENIANCKVDILDMNIVTDEQVAKYLVESSPNFICVSIRNVDGANSLDRRNFFIEYKAVIDNVKRYSSAPVILGGAGFSIFPDQFLKELGGDYGISGEGEDAICELINSLRDNSSLDSVQRLHLPNNQSNSHCRYLSSPQAKYDKKLVEFYWRESGMLNIQTKRGCPYNCIYCTYPHIDGRKVRTMDIDSIVDTIARSKRDFGAHYWFFTDSVFNIHNHYNVELCEAIIKSKLDISWGAYFSPSNITESEMKLFKESGLTHIEYGTESFCDQTLAAYGKKFTFDDVLYASELALKYNIYYAHFLILAGWGETQEQLLTTIENSKQLKHTVIFPYVGMRIYPHTVLYDRAMEEGVINKNSDLIMPHYYITEGFDLEKTRALTDATGKAWIFPDNKPENDMMHLLKIKRNKKGLLWEYLRKP